MFYRNKCRLIGVDITAKTLTVLATDRIQGAMMPRITHIGTARCAEHIFDAPTKHVKTLAAALQCAYKQSGIKQRHAALVLPSAAVMTHIMQLDRSLHTEEMYYYIQHTLHTQQGMRSDPLQMDFHIIGDHAGDNALLDVLVVTARQSHINAYITLFKQVGLKLKVIELKTHAIERAYPFIRLALSCQHNVMGMVQVDSASISVYLFVSGKVCYKEEYNTFNIDCDDMICNHIERHIQLFNTSVSNQPITCLYLMGSIQHRTNLKNKMFDKTGIQTHCLMQALITANVLSKEYINHNSVGLWTACGLTLRTGKYYLD